MVMGKVFIGTWINKDARIKLKMACAAHSINQSDVIELLILKWLKEPHVEAGWMVVLNEKDV